MRISPVLPLLFAVSASLTACDQHTDFVARLNAEPLGHTNQSNIAAMVANPADLVRGHGGGGAGAAVTTLPIQRYDADRAKPLSTSGTSSGGSSSGGASGG